MNPVMLRVEHLGFSLGGRAVLTGISFALERGGYLSVIGPNGAGKTTLLRCLMRLHGNGHMRGMVSIKGRPLSAYDQPALARVLSYVPQAGGPVPSLTVMDLLRLSRYPHRGRGGDDHTAMERALALTTMHPLADTPLAELSGGQRQRAYIAAALAQDPEILLLDEPTSALDPHHAAEITVLLRQLRDTGLTCVTVTHDVNHPLRMGGALLALREGVMVYAGPVCPPGEGGNNAAYTTYTRVLSAVFGHNFAHTLHPATHVPVILP